MTDELPKGLRRLSAETTALVVLARRTQVESILKLMREYGVTRYHGEVRLDMGDGMAWGEPLVLELGPAPAPAPDRADKPDGAPATKPEVGPDGLTPDEAALLYASSSRS